MFPEVIHIENKQQILIRDVNHFRNNEGKRRIGIEYWVAVNYEIKEIKNETTLLLQYHLNEKSDVIWLIKMVDQGRVYIPKETYDLTLDNAKRLSKTTKP